MSEHLPKHENNHHGEQQPNPYGERVIKHESHTPQVEHGRHKHEIEQLLKKIEQNASPAEKIEQIHIEQSRAEHPHNVHHGSHIKSHSSSRQALKSVQRQLSRPERQFSKLIHNNTVESVSEAVGNTAARPIGLLTAGVFSLIASIGVLIICRFYGYEYNYGIGLMFMAAGFAFGLLIEILLKLRPSKGR